MIDEVQHMVEEYRGWLRDRTALKSVGDNVEITTPFLDRHNDYLQIYVQRRGRGFLLTDAGYVVDDLESSGCHLDSARRQELLQLAVDGFGVRLNHGALEVEASAPDFALRKHSLIQAMLAVNDLYYVSAPVVTSLFLEEVTRWFDGHQIRYSARVKLPGKSGLDHSFDMLIPKSSRQPERIVRAVVRPTVDHARVLAFSWLDTKEHRPSESRAYALLNDGEDGGVPSKVVSILEAYEVRAVAWSQREDVRQELAA